MFRKSILMAALVAVTTAGASVQVAQAAETPELTSEGWHLMLAPYMWAINTSGDLTLGPIEGEFELPITTALKQLKGALQARAEVRNHRFGVAADFTYLEVAKGGAFSLPLPDGSSAAGDLDLRINFFEAWPYYRLGDDANAFDVFAGIRYNAFRTQIDVQTLGFDASRQFNWTDPIVGARWIGQVKPSLALLARADLGGFGAGSELTLNLQGGVHWQFSRVAGLAVEYRWMDIDYEKGDSGRSDYFKFDSSMHGALVGVTFAW